MTDRAEAARRTARRHKRWAWFWYANIPPVVVSYFLMPREVWEAAMLVYLALVSIWALGISHQGRAGAAKAEEASAEG